MEASSPSSPSSQVAPCQVSSGRVPNMQWRYLVAAPRYPRPRPLGVQPSLGPTAGQWCIGNVPTGDATLGQSVRFTTSLRRPQSAESLGHRGGMARPREGGGGRVWVVSSSSFPHFPVGDGIENLSNTRIIKLFTHWRHTATIQRLGSYVGGT